MATAEFRPLPPQQPPPLDQLQLPPPDEDVDDEPDALEWIHQRHDLDVETDRRATEKEHDHADEERAEEAEVVAPQNGEVDRDDQDGACEGELVHVRPGDAFGGDATGDSPCHMKEEGERRQRRPDPRPQ